MNDENHKKKKLKYYPGYSTINIEMQMARTYIADNGYGDLTPDQAEEIMNEEYFFLKKLKRTFMKERGWGVSLEQKCIADDTEFGQVFIYLIDRMNWRNDPRDILDAGLKRYYADGVTGFEALRRLMMIKGLCLISSDSACSENYFLSSLKEFFPEEK